MEGVIFYLPERNNFLAQPGYAVFGGQIRSIIHCVVHHTVGEKVH